ncbi:hypothetical protein GCM10010221_29150 [Streptomyces parvus]|nr:hypothetical protein GCM10010221_29150 [Streptomyces parvus]
MISTEVLFPADEESSRYYKPAQADVLRRGGLLLRPHPGRVRTPRVCVTPGRDRVTAPTPLRPTVPQRHDAHSGRDHRSRPVENPGRP